MKSRSSALLHSLIEPRVSFHAKRFKEDCAAIRKVVKLVTAEGNNSHELDRWCYHYSATASGSNITVNIENAMTIVFNKASSMILSLAINRENKSVDDDLMYGMSISYFTSNGEEDELWVEPHFFDDWEYLRNSLPGIIAKGSSETLKMTSLVPFSMEYELSVMGKYPVLYTISEKGTFKYRPSKEEIPGDILSGLSCYCFLDKLSLR